MGCPEFERTSESGLFLFQVKEGGSEKIAKRTNPSCKFIPLSIMHDPPMQAMTQQKEPPSLGHGKHGTGKIPG